MTGFEQWLPIPVFYGSLFRTLGQVKEKRLTDVSECDMIGESCMSYYSQLIHI